MKYLKHYFLFTALSLILVSCNIEPYEGDIPEEPNSLTCPEAIQNSANEALAFNSATSENYAQLCANYKAAIEAQIASCGDDGGAFQLVIDSLGDCSNANLPNDCSEAEVASATALDAFNSASTENYSSLCNVLKAALQTQISLCGDTNGDLQATINGLGDCTSQETPGNYWPMEIGNSWTYTAQVSGMPDTESTMTIMDRVNYQDMPSYKYENFFGALTATDGTGFENLQIEDYTRNTGGDYQVLVSEMTADLAGL